MRLLARRCRALIVLLAFSIGFGALMFVFALTAQDGLHQIALPGALAIVPVARLFLTRPGDIAASPRRRRSCRHSARRVDNV